MPTMNKKKCIGIKTLCLFTHIALNIFKIKTYILLNYIILTLNVLFKNVYFILILKSQKITIILILNNSLFINGTLYVIFTEKMIEKMVFFCFTVLSDIILLRIKILF